MGKLERGARQARRKQYVQDAVLGTIAAGGILAIAAVAPNALQLLRFAGSESKFKYQTKLVLTRLARKGYVEFVLHNGKKFVRLTERGEQTLELERQRVRLQSEKKRRWDKRYRLVIFDIPEKRRSKRELLRREMQEVGFLRVQDSTWIYPYDCEEFIMLLKTNLHLGKAVLYAIVERIENDRWIREHFKLPIND